MGVGSGGQWGYGSPLFSRNNINSMVKGLAEPPPPYFYGLPTPLCSKYTSSATHHVVVFARLPPPSGYFTMLMTIYARFSAVRLLSLIQGFVSGKIFDFGTQVNIDFSDKKLLIVIAAYSCLFDRIL